MLNIGCLIDNEDYNRIEATLKGDELPSFTYTITVEDGPEDPEPTGSSIQLYVIELQSVSLAVGFTLPKNKKIEKEVAVVFTTHPDAQRTMPKDLVVKLEFSDDQKKANHGGDDLEKLEFIGYSLEKIYETKKATFYLFDYQGITKK